MAIFGSADNVPIEMEFTEIIEARRSFTGEEIRAFLEDLRGALRTRSAHFITAFGGLSSPRNGQCESNCCLFLWADVQQKSVVTCLKPSLKDFSNKNQALEFIANYDSPTKKSIL